MKFKNNIFEKKNTRNRFSSIELIQFIRNQLKRMLYIDCNAVVSSLYHIDRYSSVFKNQLKCVYIDIYITDIEA